MENTANSRNTFSKTSSNMDSKDNTAPKMQDALDVTRIFYEQSSSENYLAFFNKAVVSGALALLVVGSGGAITSIERAGSTGSRSILQYPILARRPERRKILRARDQLLAIKNSLGITLSDMAGILLVGRPAIYEWLNGTEPRRSNQARISQFYNLSLYWDELTKYKLGGQIHILFEDGHALFEKLSSENLDIDGIRSDLKVLAHKVNLSKKAKQDRSIARKMKEAGFQPMPKEIAAATKRHISPSWIDEE
ncbi:MAG TPA: helix-turn-helix transcriptional regulator [Gammaproteobacteria bacterium]|nr:helix-turn-helix transcriptional regulator [Gammaproteobacteria bacterium]